MANEQCADCFWSKANNPISSKFTVAHCMMHSKEVIPCKEKKVVGALPVFSPDPAFPMALPISAIPEQLTKGTVTFIKYNIVGAKTGRISGTAQNESNRPQLEPTSKPAVIKRNLEDDYSFGV